MLILNKLGMLSFVFVALTGFVHLQEEINGSTKVTVKYEQGEVDYPIAYFIKELKGV